MAALLSRTCGALLLPSTRALPPSTASIPTTSNLHLVPHRPRPRTLHRFPRLLCACAPQKEQQLQLVSEPPPPTPSPPTPPPEEAVRSAAGLLDIRVGRVLRAWRHPEADLLYVEEVDVGEAEPRTICSGLVKYVPLDLLQGKDVIVLANLKPRNMRGIKSNGMLMAASDAVHENVETLVPPEGSVPGERIWFGSDEDKNAQVEAATPNQVQKKKLWETVQPHLKSTETCEAVLLGVHPMRTSAGVVSCSSLKNANIS